MKVLIVEDDEEIRGLIEYFLKKESYDTFSTGNGIEAIKIVKEQSPDLIILDLMLPGLDGINICNMIRENTEKYGNPIIVMLTAKTEIEDVIKGLKTGADDYIRKPFDPRELILRINNLLKREKNIEKNIYEYGEIKVDSIKYMVTENDIEVSLSKKEYDMLVYLIENKGIVLTREKILNRVWKENYYSGDRTVDVYIGKIREKLKTISPYIKTVKGVGYKLDEKR